MKENNMAYMVVIILAVFCVQFISCQNACHNTSGPVQVYDMECIRLGYPQDIPGPKCTWNISQYENVTQRIYWSDSRNPTETPENLCTEDVDVKCEKEHVTHCSDNNSDTCTECRETLCSGYITDCLVMVAIFPDDDPQKCTCYEKYFDMYSIVKPNKIENMRFVSVEKDRFTIQWEKPGNQVDDLIYFIKLYEWCNDLLCEKRFLGNWNVSEDSSDSETYNIVDINNHLCSLKENQPNIFCVDGIKPYRKYLVNITSMLRDYETLKPIGHMSDAVVKNVTTAEDVPAGAPLLTTGSFRMIENNKIVLYWRLIPELERNGPLVNISVNYTFDDDVNIYKEVSASKTSDTLENLSKSSKNASVCVKASTRIGYGDMESCLFICRINRPSVKDFVVRYNESAHSILYSWKPVGGISAYTLYWCQSDQLESDKNVKCKDGEPLHWEHISEESGNFETNASYFENVKKLAFAISAEKESSISSGLHFADCLYSAEEDIKPPEGEVRFDDKARSEANTLLLIWDLPDCKPGVRAHVKEYQFSYSQERSKKNETKTVLLGSESIKLTDLESEKTYKVYVQSSSMWAQSSPVYVGQRKALGTVSSLAVEIGLTVAVIGLVLLIILASSCYLWRKAKRTKGPAIELPETVDWVGLRLPEDGQNSGITEPAQPLLSVYKAEINSDDSGLGCTASIYDSDYPSVRNQDYHTYEKMDDEGDLQDIEMRQNYRSVLDKDKISDNLEKMTGEHDYDRPKPQRNPELFKDPKLCAPQHSLGVNGYVVATTANSYNNTSESNNAGTGVDDRLPDEVIFEAIQTVRGKPENCQQCNQNHSDHTKIPLTNQVRPEIPRNRVVNITDPAAVVHEPQILNESEEIAQNKDYEQIPSKSYKKANNSLPEESEVPRLFKESLNAQNKKSPSEMLLNNAGYVINPLKDDVNRSTDVVDPLTDVVDPLTDVMDQSTDVNNTSREGQKPLTKYDNVEMTDKIPSVFTEDVSAENHQASAEKCAENLQTSQKVQPYIAEKALANGLTEDEVPKENPAEIHTEKAEEELSAEYRSDAVDPTVNVSVKQPKDGYVTDNEMMFMQLRSL